MSSFTSDWFTVERLDKKTYAFSEYGHPEEAHSYLCSVQPGVWSSAPGSGSAIFMKRSKKSQPDRW